MTTKAIEAGARASLAALKEWDDLEGPLGVYDLGYHAKEVVVDPHAVRDFRPGENGRIVARFATHEEAMAEYELLTAKHYAKACIEAAIASGELVPASAVAAERERCLRAARASLEYVLVPREPTEAMLDAYWHQAGESKEMRLRTHSSARRYYTAMLTAATSNGSGK
jgi:hypothetical protein